MENYEEQKRLRRLNAALCRAKGVTHQEFSDECEYRVPRSSFYNCLKIIEQKYGGLIERPERRENRTVFRYTKTQADAGGVPALSDSNLSSNMLHQAIEALRPYQTAPLYGWTVSLLRQTLSGTDVTEAVKNVEFGNQCRLVGQEHFGPLLEAIERKQVVRIYYRKFGDTAKPHTIHPVLLKQSNNRWFLIGWNPIRELLSIYPLDRISKCTATDDKYVPCPIDLRETYKGVIGITLEAEAKYELVMLRVKRTRYDYIETKKLHESQQECPSLDDKESRVISIKVKVSPPSETNPRPNKELIAMLLQFGSDLEVLKPAFLRQQMAEIVANMSNIYNV